MTICYTVFLKLVYISKISVVLLDCAGLSNWYLALSKWYLETNMLASKLICTITVQDKVFPQKSGLKFLKFTKKECLFNQCSCLHTDFRQDSTNCLFQKIAAVFATNQSIHLHAPPPFVWGPHVIHKQSLCKILNMFIIYEILKQIDN